MRILAYLFYKLRSVGLSPRELDVYYHLRSYELEKLYGRKDRKFIPSCPTNLKYKSLT